MTGNDPWGLTSLLPWLMAALISYYVLRTVAAALLLVLSRARPALLGPAMRCAPAVLRPALRRIIAGGLLGVALTGGSALAAPTGCPAADDAVPLLDRASICAAVDDAQQPQQTGPPAAPAQQSATAPTYVVRAGDSLWRITAARLGPSATDAAIAAAWPHLWEANRAAIGDDPGLILPGTALTLPAQLVNGAAG